MSGELLRLTIKIITTLEGPRNMVNCPWGKNWYGIRKSTGTEKPEEYGDNAVIGVRA